MGRDAARSHLSRRVTPGRNGPTPSCGDSEVVAAAAFAADALLALSEVRAFYLFLSSEFWFMRFSFPYFSPFFVPARESASLSSEFLIF